MATFYKKAYIYELICSKTGDCYFGSSTNPQARFIYHKSKFNQCTSKKLINPKMNIIQTIENITKEELEYIEKDYIVNYECVNKQVPKQTNKEYYVRRIAANPNFHIEKYKKDGGIKRNIRTRKTCDCGGIYIQRNFKIHEKSLKHKKYINTI